MAKLDMCRDVLYFIDSFTGIKEPFAFCILWGDDGVHEGKHHGPSLHENGVSVWWEDDG